MADPKDNKSDAKSDSEQPKEAQNVCNISVPSIIAALHMKALAAATKKVTNCRIANSAIEDDGKTAKLKSAGEHIVTVFSKDKDGKILKSDAVTALKEYVHWFVGPDLESKVTDKVVKPLAEEKEDEKMGEESPSSTEKDEDSKAKEDEKASGSDESNDGKDDDSDDAKDQTGESLFPMFSKLLKSINEADDDKQKSDSPSDAEDNQKDKESSESNAGYYIAYDMKVNGMKETKVKDAMKDLAKGLFDSLTITASGLFGGGQSFTGKDVRKAFHDLKNIDADKLADDVKKLLGKKFPEVTSIDAFARDSNTLYRELNSSYGSQLSKEQKTAIREAPYSVCIKVKENDPSRPFLNSVKIADAIRKCISFFKTGSKMKVDKDSIIVIDDFIDTRFQEKPEADKRPSFSNIHSIILKDFKKDKKGNLTPIDHDKCLSLYTKIEDKFKKLRQSSKAMKQDENLKAVKIFDKFSTDILKKLDKENDEYNYSDFKQFLDEYKKFDDSIKKESITCLTRYDIANLLFESIFTRNDKLWTYIVETPEGDSFERRKKTAAKVKQAREEENLKNPMGLKSNDDGEDVDVQLTDDQVDQAIINGSLDFKDGKFVELNGKIRIDPDGTIETPVEKKRRSKDEQTDDSQNHSDKNADKDNDKKPNDKDDKDTNDKDSNSKEVNNNAGSENISGSDDLSGSENVSSKDDKSDGTVLYVYPVLNSEKFDDGMED